MAAATGGQTLGAMPLGEEAPKPKAKSQPRSISTTAIEWQYVLAEYMELLIAHGHVNVTKYTPAQVMYYAMILMNRISRVPTL